MKWILLLTLLLLGACGREYQVPTLTDPTPDQELAASDHGLSLSISKHDYKDSMPFLETTLNNDSQISYEYGEYYHIEVYKENEWYIMTHSDSVFLENPRFTNLGKLLPPGKEIHQTFSVEMLGVALLPGQYRLVKIFIKAQEPVYEVTVAVPFTVESHG